MEGNDVLQDAHIWLISRGAGTASSRSKIEERFLASLVITKWWGKFSEYRENCATRR